MTAISTLLSVLVTPLLFAFWASMNPQTMAVLERIEIDPRRVVMVLLIMLVVPVAAGMTVRAARPDIADKIRLWARRIAGIVFAVVVAVLLLGNVGVLGSFARIALPPVLVTFAIAVVLGWSFARVSGLAAADRRAVTLEVAFQNVALAIGLAVAFFPGLAGVAITSILWGVVHLTLGFAIAAMWMRMPIAGEPQEALTAV
jgi:BASS family bile acid:Na+ symporter